MNLEGKIAPITCGGIGIGAAIAKRFVTDGARAYIVGRRLEVLLDEMVMVHYLEARDGRYYQLERDFAIK